MCICADSFKHFLLPCMVNINLKFWLPTMKTLTNYENLFSNRLQIACCGIQEAACVSVNCSVSRRWFWSVQRYYRRTIDSDFSKDELGSQFPLSCCQSCLGGGGGILRQLPVKSPELVSVFIDACRTLTSIFLFFSFNPLTMTIRAICDPEGIKRRHGLYCIMKVSYSTSNFPRPNPGRHTWCEFSITFSGVHFA